MDLTVVKQKLNNSQIYSIETINKCPYCDQLMTPSYIKHDRLPWKNELKLIYYFLWKCPNANCEGYFITFNNSKKYPQTSAEKFVYESHYPIMRTYYFDEQIINLSPKFAELYNQAFTSEMMGFKEIAAIGYRASLEILIKDYANKELGIAIDVLTKKKLNAAIKEFVPEYKVPADVVRLLGNDYAHYTQEFDVDDFELLKKNLDIFVKQIDAKLSLKHAPKSKTGKTISSDRNNPNNK